jgi:aminoglycoside 3-N-acetyltransferase
VLVEFLRTFPGAVVSQHPTRFVAWGRDAREIVADQPWNFAFGAGSPLDHLRQRDGKVLLLGADHDTVTFLHHVEHVVDFPGKRVARFKVPVLEGGERVWRDMAEYDSSSSGVHANWPDRFFARIVDGFIVESGNRGGTVGQADCHLLHARELFDFASHAMVAQAADVRAADGLKELAT